MIQKRTILFSNIVDNETILATPLAIPTAYPTDPQVTITVNEEMMYDAICPPMFGHLAHCFLSLNFTKLTSGAGSNYVTTYLNGVATGLNNSSFSSSTSNQQIARYTLIPNVKVGDVITAKISHSVSGVLTLEAVRWVVFPATVFVSGSCNMAVGGAKILETDTINDTVIGRTLSMQTTNRCRPAVLTADNSSTEYANTSTTYTAAAGLYLGQAMLNKRSSYKYLFDVLAPTTNVNTSTTPASTNLMSTSSIIPTKIKVKFMPIRGSV